jgi:hypothetical protein
MASNLQHAGLTAERGLGRTTTPEVAAYSSADSDDDISEMSWHQRSKHFGNNPVRLQPGAFTDRQAGCEGSFAAGHTADLDAGCAKGQDRQHLSRASKSVCSANEVRGRRPKVGSVDLPHNCTALPRAGLI